MWGGCRGGENSESPSRTSSLLRPAARIKSRPYSPWLLPEGRRSEASPGSLLRPPARIKSRLVYDAGYGAWER
ncbi:hypothetical protein B1F68_24705 [Pseudomonas syringae]|nr:hypothetical protein B1F68_24705 [Pseudomonas syringae]